MMYFLDLMIGAACVENIIWAAKLNKVWNALFYMVLAAVYLCLRLQGALNGNYA